jgi:hypothetical protein
MDPNLSLLQPHASEHGDNLAAGDPLLVECNL